MIDAVAQYERALQLAASGRAVQAAKLLVPLCRQHPQALEPRLRLAELAVQQRYLAPTAVLVELIAPHLDSPELAALAERLVGARETEAEIEPLADLLLARESRSPPVWRAKLLAAARRSAWSELLQHTDRLFADAEICPAHFTVSRRLLLYGQAERAAGWARRTLNQGHGPIVDPWRDQLEQLIEEAAGGGEPYLGNGNALVVRARGPARATVLVFGGLNHRPGVAVESLHLTLARAGANVVVLTDPRRLFYLASLEPFGGDFDQTAAGFRRMIRELPAPRLLFLGSSAGGFSAIRFAAEMPEVDQVLVGGAPTTLDPSDPLVADSPRAKDALDRLSAAAPDRRENLRPLLERRRPSLPITAIYGELHPKDSRHGDNIAGAPGVTLCPIAGMDGHDVFRRLSAQGRFETLLSHFVQGTLSPEKARELVG